MSRGDGRLYITYNEMGQGDNILICCPNGKVIVIDCGSSRWDGNYYQEKPTVDQLREKAIKTLYEPNFLGNNQTIDALILTHADQDHCNEVQSIFNHTLKDRTPRVTGIDALYFSGSLVDYATKGNAKHYLEVTKPPTNSYPITVNATKQTLGNIHIQDSASNTSEINKKSRKAETEGFIKIIDGTKLGGIGGNTPVGVPCSVYILASNVEAYPNINDGYDNTPEGKQNRSSVVTMVIYGDKKFLFVGDATFHTEKFLIDTYGQKIKDLEMLHVGHHASYRTSSSYKNDKPVKEQTRKNQLVKDIDFISHVNPKYLVISAAYDSGKSLQLPRRETINNFIAGASRLVDWPGKRIYCHWWQAPVIEVTKTGPEGGIQKKRKKIIAEASNIFAPIEINKYILCTGSDGILDFNYKETTGRNVLGYINNNGIEKLLP